jgi:methanogenic corrinoid protein MtbC1
MYTIKEAAARTGLTEPVLRAWERRYGVVTPHRTEAGYRLYDDESVKVLSAMSSLVLQGWSPRQAAQEVMRRSAAGEIRPVLDSTPAGVSGGTTTGATTPSGVVGADEFVDAAADFDGDAMTRLLDEHFGRASFESVVDDWLMPSLVALGEAWESGQVSVAGEHLVSNAVQRRLAAAYDAAASQASGPRILVGLTPGARHELGALAFAAAARRLGLNAAYVGADLPASDWVSATRTHRAVCAVLAVSQVADVTGLRSVVAGLRVEQPDVMVAVGGALAHLAPEECVRLGDRIGTAAARLASMLSARRTSSSKS